MYGPRQYELTTQSNKEVFPCRNHKANTGPGDNPSPCLAPSPYHVCVERVQSLGPAERGQYEVTSTRSDFINLETSHAQQASSRPKSTVHCCNSTGPHLPVQCQLSYPILHPGQHLQHTRSNVHKMLSSTFVAVYGFQQLRVLMGWDDTAGMLTQQHGNGSTDHWLAHCAIGANLCDFESRQQAHVLQEIRQATHAHSSHLPRSTQLFDNSILTFESERQVRHSRLQDI